MKKLRKKHINEVKRFIKYMIGGNAQFWSGYISYAIFDLVFHIDFWPARIASYFVGVSVNFFIERFWAFNEKKISKKQVESSAQRYYFLSVVNFVLDMAIVGGLRAIGISPYIGQFISAGFFTVWNYLIFKLWVFRKNRRRK